MNTVLFALVLLPLLQSESNAPVGRPEVGKTTWNAPPAGAGWCRNCHGEKGEGGYGPDLAGRGLSFAQFKRAVRTPWGVMAAYTERQVSDQTLADFYAFLMSLPKVAEPAEWREPAPPPDAPPGQILLITNGCGQCHQRELLFPRTVLGGKAADVDYEHFAKEIYGHSELYPGGRMGNYSRRRLPDSVLQEIFRFITQDLGLVPPIAASIRPGVLAGTNTTYTLTVQNRGVKDKGLTAEEVTISLALSPGTAVVGGTGAGYLGVRRDPQTESDVAVWQVQRIAPGEQQTYTLSVAGTAAAPSEMFKGSVVRWAKPEIRKGVPNLVLRDARIPGKEAQVAVTFPTPAQP